jgi:outer membrane protein assembly factor BamD (BamD/ComL family)
VTQAPPRTATGTTQAPPAGRRRAAPRAGLALGLASCALLLGGGCAASWNPFKRADASQAGDGVLVRTARLDGAGKPAPGAADMDAARELYARGDYAKAEGLFAKVANNAKNPQQLCEEARYCEADCLVHQKRYAAAVGTYKQQLKDFPSGAHQKEALKQMFDIANYWLEDTREVMRAEIEHREGKRSIVLPASFVHFEKTKPLFDEEGSACAALEMVYLNDPLGALGEKALWYIGNVRLFHEDFRDADFYFAQILKNYPNGEFAPKALELSIICKQMATGGPDYDGIKLAEARKLVDVAQKAYPELAAQKSEFLYRQVATINLQQAAKDFGVAQFYERTFHPGAAYFCYEIVRRRYPGTKYEAEAVKRMNVLRERAEKELHSAPKGGPVGLLNGPAVSGAPLMTRPSDPPAPGLLPGLGGRP